MPEGDTIAKAADGLNRALAGSRIIKTDFRVPSLATTDLAGQTLIEVVARGKHLLMRTEGGMTIHTHLKMDGAWRLLPPGRPVADRRDEVRLVVETDRATAVGTELGIVELFKTADEDRVLGHLGPDLLGPGWDAAEALRRLAANPARPIGEALLDQTVMAGIGNVYKSEICFLRGVEPATPVGVVPDPRAVIDLAHRLLLANRATGNQVTTGDPRRDRRHWVYGRAGEPCRRCGTSIMRRIDGEPGESGERVTYWCPSCQPEASAIAGGTRPKPRSGSRSRPSRGSRRPTR
ncbi:MAG TPA: DNA-formamidopyrimidine glycosylase family protein [Actinomycetota bacterium]|nr:DNA-formamidopyrimidine glycosylase family protein [Actinomycetota bacterium]